MSLLLLLVGAGGSTPVPEVPGIVVGGDFGRSLVFGGDSVGSEGKVFGGDRGVGIVAGGDRSAG